MKATITKTTVRHMVTEERHSLARLIDQVGYNEVLLVVGGLIRQQLNPMNPVEEPILADIGSHLVKLRKLIYQFEEIV